MWPAGLLRLAVLFDAMARKDGVQMQADRCAAGQNGQRVPKHLRRFVEPAEIPERKTQIVEDLGIVGTQCQRLVVSRFRLLRTLEFAQGGAEIIPGLCKIRRQFDRPAIGRLRFLAALERAQHVAAVAVRLDEVRSTGDGAILAAQGFGIFLLFVECDAEVAHRADMVRAERQRATRMRDRFAGAAGKPAHLAEVGVVERDAAVERDRPADMLDCFDRSPGLMRDDAEQMRGLGAGRAVEDIATELLRLAKPAGVAMLLRQDERLAGRKRNGGFGLE